VKEKVGSIYVEWPLVRYLELDAFDAPDNSAFNRGKRRWRCENGSCLVSISLTRNPSVSYLRWNTCIEPGVV